MEIKLHQFEGNEDETLLYLTIENKGKVFQIPIRLLPDGYPVAELGSKLSMTVTRRIELLERSNKYIKTITL